nr:hypothetical protein [Hassalia byssoidea]
MHICQEGAGKGDIIVMRSPLSNLIIVAIPAPSPKILPAVCGLPI